MIMILCGIFVGYQSGYYNGMKDICNEDLIQDDEGNIYCGDLNKYKPKDIYLLLLIPKKYLIR